MAVSRARISYGVSTAWPTAMAERNAVVVDLETTGLSAQRDRAIEIAAVRLHDGRIADQWHTLLNPGVAVPPFITALTGISAGMAASAPTFAQVVDDFRAFLGNSIFIAHNANFDLG